MAELDFGPLFGRPDWAEQLVLDHPKVFPVNAHGDFDRRVNELRQVGEGWRVIVGSLCDDLESTVSAPAVRFRLDQFARKHDSLRPIVYYGDSESVAARIALAESEASKTCELCGGPGTQWSGTHLAGVFCRGDLTTTAALDALSGPSTE
jgi:hypothetical protein